MRPVVEQPSISRNRVRWRKLSIDELERPHFRFIHSPTRVRIAIVAMQFFPEACPQFKRGRVMAQSFDLRPQRLSCLFPAFSRKVGKDAYKVTPPLSVVTGLLNQKASLSHRQTDSNSSTVGSLAPSCAPRSPRWGVPNHNSCTRQRIRRN